MWCLNRKDKVSHSQEPHLRIVPVYVLPLASSQVRSAPPLLQITTLISMLALYILYTHAAFLRLWTFLFKRKWANSNEWYIDTDFESAAQTQKDTKHTGIIFISSYNVMQKMVKNHAIENCYKWQNLGHYGHHWHHHHESIQQHETLFTDYVNDTERRK